MKECKDCGAKKPLTDFYQHAKMADGHLNKCKACVKARVGRHRAENLDQARAYDRSRGQDPARKEAYREWYRRQKDDPEHRRRRSASSTSWSERNKLKRACHVIVGNAFRDGRLQRAEACERCGAPDPEAHHEDYLEPFSIDWLCKACHGARHREINKERRRETSCPRRPENA